MSILLIFKALLNTFTGNVDKAQEYLTYFEERKEAIKNLDLDDLLSIEPTKKAGVIVEDEEDGDV